MAASATSVTCGPGFSGSTRFGLTAMSTGPTRVYVVSCSKRRRRPSTSGAASSDLRATGPVSSLFASRPPPGRRRVPRRARREVRQVRAERLVLERRVVVRQPRRVDLERRARAVVDGRPRRAVAVVARDRDDLDDAPQRLGLVGGVQPGPAPGRRLLSLRRRVRLGGQFGSHLFFVRVGCSFVLSSLVREQQTCGLSRPGPPRTFAAISHAKNGQTDEVGTTWRT